MQHKHTTLKHGNLLLNIYVHIASELHRKYVQRTIKLDGAKCELFTSTSDAKGDTQKLSISTSDSRRLNAECRFVAVVRDIPAGFLSIRFSFSFYDR